MRLRSSAGTFTDAPSRDGGDRDIAGVEIGQRLVGSGRLSRADMADILAHQRETGTDFADAAVALGKLDAREVGAFQGGDASGLLAAGDDRIDPTVRAAFVTGEPYVEQVRAIRSKIIAAERAAERRDRGFKIALVGIAAGDETSVLAANLAVVFAQLGSRTLLVDCGLADPVIDTLFRVPGDQGVAETLRGASAGAAARETALPALAVVPAGAGSASAQSDLHRQALAKVIDRWGVAADHVLVNLPAMEASGRSLGTILAGFDGAILVTRKAATRIEDVRTAIDSLDAQKVAILGSVIS